MNVVSIMAHADDEMRCLGTMLKCRARGDRLSFITLTDGSNGFVQNPGIPRQEAARIRQRAYDVAAAKSADYDAKASEGLIPLSDALDARAVMDFAQVELVQSRYQERIAIANLELAMGITLVPQEKTETKEEK